MGGRATRWMVDGAVAVAVAVPTAMDAWWSPAGSRQSDIWSYGLVLLPAAGLLIRRRWPVTLALVCALCLFSWYGAGYQGELTGLALAVALYTVARQGDRRRSVVAGLGALLLFTALAVLAGDLGLPATGGALPIAALLLGETARNREELLAEQALRAERAHRERDAQARDRAHRERLQLAQGVARRDGAHGHRDDRSGRRGRRSVRPATGRRPRRTRAHTRARPRRHRRTAR